MKRFISLVVCFALIFTVFTISAYACNNDQNYNRAKTGTIHGEGVNLRPDHNTNNPSGASLNTNDVMSITKYYIGSDYRWEYGTVTSCSQHENIGLRGWVAADFITIA